MSDGHFNFPTATDPLVVSQYAGLARTLIAALAGAGILGGAWAAVSAEQIANMLTAFLTVGGALVTAWMAFWSWRQKMAEAKASKVLQNAAAVASAEQTAKATVDAGRPVLVPVTVNVTPEGQENEAVKVSGSEAAAAPSVPVNVTPSPAPRAA